MWYVAQVILDLTTKLSQIALWQFSEKGVCKFGTASLFCRTKAFGPFQTKHYSPEVIFSDLYYRAEKNPGDKLKKEPGYAVPEISLRFETNLDF